MRERSMWASFTGCASAGGSTLQRSARRGTGSRAAPGAKQISAPSGARLVVGAKVVGIFHAPNAGLSPQERAEKAAEHLKRLMATGLTPGQIEVRNRAPNWDVYARGELLMVATPK